MSIVDDNETLKDIKETSVDRVKENEPNAIEDKDQNVTINYSWTTPLTAKDTIEAETISLPSDFQKKIEKQIENTPNIQLVDNAASRKWVQVLQGGINYNSYNGVFEKTLERDESEFKQHVDHNGKILQPQEPKITQAENTKLTGEAGVIRMLSTLGYGSLFSMPLWHSGIWVTFKQPNDAAIIDIHRLLVSDKIRFGRFTYGLAYSNTSVYTNDRLVNFALSHIYDTTIKNEDLGNKSLKDIILSQDIPSLLLGLASVIFTSGYNYSRACSENPGKCNNVIEEKINLSKLLFTDNSALSDWQKTHMSVRRANSKSLADIKRYQEELKPVQTKRIVLEANDKLAITIKSPTISEFVDNGQIWINEIVNLVEKTIALHTSEDEKDTFIMQNGQATVLRQYGHWIQSIDVASNTIEDNETLATALNSLSSKKEIREEIVKHVIEYINNSTISVVGIPKFECPSCNALQEGSVTYPRHQNILPLDITQFFFDLIMGRVVRISQR